MALTKEEVIKVASLARLKFSEEEIAKFQVELNDILTYIDMLDELEIDNTPALVQVSDKTNNLRNDEVRKSLTQAEALHDAPEVADGNIVVPKVVGE